MKIACNPEVIVVQNPAVSGGERKSMKHRRKRRTNVRRSQAGKRTHRRYSRNASRPARRHRRTRRNVGSYAAFVKKHKGLYKKFGFKGAAKRIAAMWRNK